MPLPPMTRLPVSVQPVRVMLPPIAFPMPPPRPSVPAPPCDTLPVSAIRECDYAFVVVNAATQAIPSAAGDGQVAGEAAVAGVDDGAGDIEEEGAAVAEAPTAA